MNADELRDLGRRAANYTGYRQICVLGSQGPRVAAGRGAAGDHDPVGGDRSRGPDNPVTLLFPEIHDLCASKLTVAVTGGFGRRSDRAFIRALVEDGHIDLDVLDSRVDQLPDSVSPRVRQAAHAIVAGLR